MENAAIAFIEIVKSRFGHVIVFAGLLAQKLDGIAAAAAACFIHGLAADLIAEEIYGTTGIIATDLISYLPRAIAKCQQSKNLKLVP